MRKKAIIFLPEAAIIQYLRTMCIFADALKKDGYDIYFIKCGSILPFCTCMSLNLSQTNNIHEIDKNQLCEQCNNLYKNTQKIYNFQQLDLKNYIENELLQEAVELVNNTPSDELIDFTYKNINFGKIASYSFILDTKLLTFDNLTEQQTEIFKKTIIQTIIMYQCAKNTIKELNPDIVLCFNSYSQCSAVKKACKEDNVNFKYITCQSFKGANFALPIIYNNDTDIYKQIQNWVKYKNFTIPKQIISSFFEDIKFRLYGSDGHIFSTSKKNTGEIIKELNLDINKKIVGVYTSSYDELTGFFREMEALDEAYNDANFVFENQLDWLNFLKEIAKENKDIQFVVRIHPREGCGEESEHLKLLRKHLDNKIDNFKIIWPENKISSYDLMEIIDIALTSWSYMGIEINRLGVPVMSYTSNFTYPNNGLVEIAKTKEEYKNNLFKLLNKALKYEDLRAACNYFYYISFGSCLDMRKTLSPNVTKMQDFKPVKKEFIKPIIEILENKYSILEYNIQKLEKANLQKGEEKEAIKLGIRQIIDKFYFPNNMTKKDFKFKIKRFLIKIFTHKKITFEPKEIYNDYILKYSENILEKEKFIKETKNNKDLRYIIKDGIFSILLINGQEIKRISKMVSNLARIHCEE